MNRDVMMAGEIEDWLGCDGLEGKGIKNNR